MLPSKILNLQLFLSLWAVGTSTKETSNLRRLNNSTTQSHEVAIYDPMFGAPYCPNVGSECSSSDLVIGRGKIHGIDEHNAPNTIDGCVDGDRECTGRMNR